MYEPAEDGGRDPLAVDVLGLYPGAHAPAVAGWTSTIDDDGTGALDD